ncbi:MAG TPA: hypothetical protein VHB21_22230 [Minicystis sp.]|nr:hypothetical protein [Minicystis sp.]
MRFSHVAALASTAVLLAAAVAGCSDTPPPPPKGGYSVEFSPGTAGMCNLQPHNGDVGMVSGTSASGVVANGDSGAEITCTVSGSGTFAVDASAAASGNALTVHIPKIDTKATATNPAHGTASFASPNTSGIAYASPADKPCDFWFEGSQTVASGKIWASFSCDDVSDGMHDCALPTGVIVFENCSTGAAQ